MWRMYRLVQFEAVSCNEVDDGDDPSKPLSVSRHRWLAMPNHREIPPHVWAAHIVWVNALRS